MQNDETPDDQLFATEKDYLDFMEAPVEPGTVRETHYPVSDYARRLESRYRTHKGFGEIRWFVIHGKVLYEPSWNGTPLPAQNTIQAARTLLKTYQGGESD